MNLTQTKIAFQQQAATEHFNDKMRYLSAAAIFAVVEW